VQHLKPQIVDEQIFPHVALGFGDTVPAMREQTVKVTMPIHHDNDGDGGSDDDDDNEADGDNDDGDDNDLNDDGDNGDHCYEKMIEVMHDVLYPEILKGWVPPIITLTDKKVKMKKAYEKSKSSQKRGHCTPLATQDATQHR